MLMVKIKMFYQEKLIYNVISDEPTHVDFLRVVPGVKVRIEVPVNLLIMKSLLV